VDTAIVAALALATIFMGGMAVYLAGSFLLMWRHVPARGWIASFRELVREAFWVALTQPLLPLYYLLGRRMAGGSGTPVVFVHGYFQNRVGFLYLARALARRGVGPLYAFNYSWLRDVPTIARGLSRFVARVLEETRAAEVDLVCHSMGGLVAVHYLAYEGGVDRVRRCATIATPHKGVQYRGPILGAAGGALRAGHGIAQLPGVRWLSIYSTHDNVVHPASSSHLDDSVAENVSVGGVGHLAILFQGRTADVIARFLAADGRASPAFTPGRR
jgi:pimeloyl-ACP methyl ester carboxylesterase